VIAIKYAFKKMPRAREKRTFNKKKVIKKIYTRKLSFVSRYRKKEEKDHLKKTQSRAAEKRKRIHSYELLKIC